MLIRRSISEPIRTQLTQEQRWNAEDNGLIACWENGRQLAIKNPEIAEAAKAGQLIPLDWKGGLAAELKTKRKIGTHFYLATWIGLRGESLQIDTAEKPSVTCSKFGVTVTFSGDFNEYANA